MEKTKKVQGIHGPGSTHWVGDGFHVRNMFPSNGLEDELNPFLMLDYAGPTYYKPTSQPQGVDEHPHRGFETVTIAYQGSLEHRDSAGNSGTIRPGDVQWMTAASGVVHEEKHEREFIKKGGIQEMIQLWVNLPKAYKMSKPRYQTLLKEEIPLAAIGQSGGSSLRVIAGKWNGIVGPAKTFTPVNLYDIQLKAGDAAEVNLTAGYSSAVLLLKGDVSLNSSQSLQGEAKLALLETEGERVSIEAKEDSVLLVLNGEPIREPVASYCPFVMNTQDEIRQAVEDYRAWRMGHLR
ncbi:MAG: pirin family protein [Bryobacteraceae bacterium]